MPSAKRRLVKILPPMLTFEPSSSKASDMKNRSRKMLKNMSGKRYLCSTPTVFLNHSPMLPFILIALVALS